MQGWLSWETWITGDLRADEILQRCTWQAQRTHSFTHQSANCDAELDNYHWVFAFCVISTGEADQLHLCYPTCYCRASKCKPFCFFVFFFLPPPPRIFQSYSTSFHGRPAFNGELVAILMRVLFGHGTPVCSRPALPTVALLWRRHWKSCTHLSPTDTNQGNREKHSKHNDRLIMLGLTIDCLFFFFLSHLFTYFFLRHFWPWLLSCRTRFSLEPGGRAPSASLIFFVMQPNVTKVWNFSSTCNWNEKYNKIWSALELASQGWVLPNWQQQFSSCSLAFYTWFY